ncbi:MAG: IclR family transcriptional regulator [Planctomycetes bacterium]|nr:IclR family transcriptional regulator [Planctomycetota bacterium]
MNASSATRNAQSSRYRAPALEKGLDILELLSDRPDGLSQTEIARSLDRSVGEIFRMLNCLVERGYLAIQRPGDRYILTLKLFELSHKNPPIHRLISDAVPLMRELAERVHQSCHLVVIEAGHGVVVAQVDSPGYIGFAVRVGSVITLHKSASGRVLLAFQTGEDRERVLARRTETESASFDRAKFDAAIDAIKKRGHEDSESTRTRGVRDLSFPILNHRGAAVAALTIPFIEHLDVPVDPSLSACKQALGETAGRLSALIGGKASMPFDPVATRTSRRGK